MDWREPIVSVGRGESVTEPSAAAPPPPAPTKRVAGGREGDIRVEEKEGGRGGRPRGDPAVVTAAEEGEASAAGSEAAPAVGLVEY